MPIRWMSVKINICMNSNNELETDFKGCHNLEKPRAAILPPTAQYTYHTSSTGNCHLNIFHRKLFVFGLSCTWERTVLTTVYCLACLSLCLNQLTPFTIQLLFAIAIAHSLAVTSLTIRTGWKFVPVFQFKTSLLYAGACACVLLI